MSAFDGWGRAVCSTYAAKATEPNKAARVSFQNIARVRDRLSSLFGFDAEATLGSSTVAGLHRAFQKRHLLAHRMGVIDDDYLRQTGDPNAVAGRRVIIDAAEVLFVAQGVRRWAEALTRYLGGIR